SARFNDRRRNTVDYYRLKCAVSVAIYNVTTAFPLRSMTTSGKDLYTSTEGNWSAGNVWKFQKKNG
ncbi:MAG: hypothetical protein QMC48_03695, partial [SAR324 cluster bacterium]